MPLCLETMPDILPPSATINKLHHRIYDAANKTASFKP